VTEKYKTLNTFLEKKMLSKNNEKLFLIPAKLLFKIICIVDNEKIDNPTYCNITIKVDDILIFIIVNAINILP
jgi:hypothetical protein